MATEPSKPQQIIIGSDQQKLRYKQIGEFATELGLMVYEWNRLQENLGILFSCILTGDPMSNKGLSVWHSTPSDRAQRNMLRALIRTTEQNEAFRPFILDQFPRSREDIEWIIACLDHKPEISNERNNIAHAVYIMKEGIVAPDDVFQNPRSMNLKGKKLIARVKWCRDCCLVLSEYAWAILGGLNLGFDPTKRLHFAWPDRPQLPNRGSYH